MISIVIITYNGANKVPRLLLSLNQLDLNLAEVILVNDGSTDDTLEVVSKLKLNYIPTIITQENSGRGQAKNKGAAAARFGLLWFLDDDMKVLPETLMAHLNHHAKHPDTISVGSTIEDAEFVRTDIQKYRLAITNNWKSIIEAIPNPLPVEDLFIASANFSISKALFRQLNGFDSRLYDAEDLDLAYRAYLENIPIYYNKEAIGYHMDIITCYSYVRRNRQYTKGYAILRSLNPHYYEINKRMHFSQPKGYRKVLLSLISQPIFVWLIDHFNVFMILPTGLRYRFYELLIFGIGRYYTNRKLING